MGRRQGRAKILTAPQKARKILKFVS